MTRLSAFSRSRPAWGASDALLAGLLGLAVGVAPSAQAANPAQGTLEPTANAQVAWAATATGGAADSEASCVEGTSCDSYTLTVSGTAADWAHKKIQVRIGWGLQATDYDLVIHKDSATGPVVATSAEGFTVAESAFINPGATGTGTYVIRVVYFAATPLDPFSATATVNESFTPSPSTEAPPRFATYPAPGGLGTSAGEPTLGVNWATGNVMFIAGLQTLRVSFDDSSSPARTTWTNVSALNTSAFTFDPILFTDSDAGKERTNRTLVSQLLPTKVSLMSFTDDDGESWTPSQGSGINSGVDHQTVGGGPFTPNVLGRGPLTAYKHAVYYASQDVGVAEIALSRDGGLTFEVAIPMWTLAQCGGLHGHIKVAPDGTVYVPNKSCGGQQAVAVSTNNGLTWAIRPVPGSTSGNTDPSLGIGSDGTIYFGYANGDGRPRIAVSRDRGLTWAFDQDVGASWGVQNSVFPAVVAGDGDRAAFFFLGTTTGGDGTGVDATFTGAWYPFIATTYDGGRSWVTVNATPNDPVQRGSVCTNGTTCPSDPVNTRNLLDFNDVTLDKQGRVVAALADGCVTAECIQGLDRNNDGKVDSLDNDGSDLATIIRQSGGKTLFAAYDAQVSALPAAPLLVANLDGAQAHLAWSVPDDGGSALTGYRLYRVVAGSESLLAALDGTVHAYTDHQSVPEASYRVSALNARGEGARSAKVAPSVAESACRMPGITGATDGTDAAPNLPLAGPVDIKSLHIAEPYSADGGSRLVFTLKVGPGSAPVNSQWYLLWNRAAADGAHDRNYVAMRTNLLGQPSFEHGRINYPLVYTSPSANQGNIPTAFGAIQGSYDAATGTITLSVPTDKVDSPTPGQSLIGLEARTFLGRNDALPINQNLSSDFAVAAPYALVGNSSCLKAPANPTDLVAATSRPREIQLSWADKSTTEERFSIERAAGSPTGAFEEIGSVGADVTTFTDHGADRKTTYFYRVRALNGGGNSAYTNIVGVQRKG